MNIRQERWTNFSLDGVKFPAMTVDVIQRGEALAIFERVHFPTDIKSRSSIYSFELCWEGSREMLKSTEEWTILPRTIHGLFRPRKRNGTHMQKVS